MSSHYPSQVDLTQLATVAERLADRLQVKSNGQGGGVRLIVFPERVRLFSELLTTGLVEILDDRGIHATARQWTGGRGMWGNSGEY